MAFANGVFSRLYSWVTDRDGGIKVRADRMDAEMDGIKDALNEITAGTVQMIGSIKGYDGSVTTPGYGFNADTNTGIYRIGTDNLGVAVGGSKIIDVSSTGVVVTGLLEPSKGADIASASTLNLTTATGMFPDITGTTTVTAVTLGTGKQRMARARGAFQMTASSSLIINGSTSSNYTTTDGDLLIFEGYASSIVRVTTISSATSFATNAEVLAAASTTKSVNPAGLASLIQNINNNAFEIADLKGTRLNMAGGIADAYDSETDVDTAASTNESYDSVNDLYSPTTTAASLISMAGLTTIGDFDTRLTAFTDGTTSQANAAASGKISAGSTANAWVGKDLTTARSIDNVVVYPSNDSGSAGGGIATLTINLRGSNSSPASRSDGTLLGTTGAFSDDTATRTINSSDATAYRYVWLEYIASSGSDQWFLAEWQLYQRGTTNNMTLVSNAFTATAVPTQARIAVFIDPQVSITINTDFTAEVSRDGGTTWTAVTLAIVSNPVGTVEQYEGTVSISSQPSGTSMEYRLRTLNNKDIDVTGVVFQWS